MIKALISSDTHVIEPPDLWTTRMPKSLRDHAPRVVQIGDEEWWVHAGKRGGSFHTGNQTGDRFVNPLEMHPSGRFEEVRPGGWDPIEHLRDNATDGIVASLLYPTEGLISYAREEDLELMGAICSAYNDWIADFVSATPTRLKAAAMILPDDVDGAVAELKRARDIGLSGGLLPVSPSPLKNYDDPSLEPLWAAAEDLEMPLGLHIGAIRVGSGGLDSEDIGAIRPSLMCTDDYFVKRSIADIIFAGVLDRHPRLRVGTVEHELGWIPHFLTRMDYTYTQRCGNAKFLRFKDGALPSDLFRRQVFCSFQDDALGIQERHVIGVDGIMFGSDYPHPESTYPRTRSIMEERLKDVDEVEREKITFSNAARLYGFDTERLAAVTVS